MLARHLHRRCSVHGGITEETVVEVHGGTKTRNGGTRSSDMTLLYEDPCYTFRFADDRIIPRFHLEGVEVGRHVSVFKIDPGTGERLGLFGATTGGEGGRGE